MATTKRPDNGKPVGIDGFRCLMILLPVSLSLLSPYIARADDAYPFRDPDLAEAVRLDDLLGRMTLEEKIAALGGDASVPRLDVTGARQIEGYHGVAQSGPSNWGGFP